MRRPALRVHLAPARAVRDLAVHGSASTAPSTAGSSRSSASSCCRGRRSPTSGCGTRSHAVDGARVVPRRLRVRRRPRRLRARPQPRLGRTWEAAGGGGTGRSLAQPPGERVAVAVLTAATAARERSTTRGVGEEGGDDARAPQRGADGAERPVALAAPRSCCACRSRRCGRAPRRRSRPRARARRGRRGRRRTRARGADAQRPVDVLDVGEEVLVEQPRAVDRGRARPPSARRPRGRCGPRPSSCGPSGAPVAARAAGVARQQRRRAGPPTARARPRTAACPRAPPRPGGAPRRPAAPRAPRARARRRC